MPTAGGKICAVGIAALFRAYSLCIDFDVPNVVIEELFTKPNDSLPQRGLDAYRALFATVGQYLTAVDGDYAAVDHIDAMRAAYKSTTEFADAKIRADGRVGLLSYAKGAGFLHMVALWGWPIAEIKPSIWLRDMRTGVDKSLPNKQRSIAVAKSLWPTMFDPHAPLSFYRTPRCKSPDDGLVESALLAEWWRRRTARGAA